jgi:hypothetical protein
LDHKYRTAVVFRLGVRRLDMHRIIG